MRKILHIDMNSYFATVEQQANPYLRGKPVGVKGSHAKRTIIAAASIEAKKYGVKTGMPEHEAVKLCPELIVVVGEPRKYSSVTKKFIEIFGRYTDKVEIFSIDEAFLDVTNTSHLYVSKFQMTKPPSTSFGVDKLQINSKISNSKPKKHLSDCHSGIASWNEQYPESRGDQKLDSRCDGNDRRGRVILRTEDEESWCLGKGSLHTVGMTKEGDCLGLDPRCGEDDMTDGAVEIAKRIKADIRREIGEWITCSVGVAPNKFLAKLGSDLEKPDGLVVITDENKDEILTFCKLTDFCGIASRIESRLNHMGIYSVKDLRKADDLALKKEFGTYGLKIKRMAWGIDNSEVLDWHEQADAKSFGHSRTLNRDVTKRDEILGQLYLLSEKVAKRMRDEDYFGKEVGIWLRFKDFTGTSKRHRIGYWVNDGHEIYKAACEILDEIYFNCHSGIASWNEQYPESRNSLKLDSCFHGNDERGGKSSHFHSNNKKPIRAMGVYVTRIAKVGPLSLFEEDRKKEKMLEVMDSINDRFGEDTVFKGMLLNFPFKKIVSGLGRKKF